MKSNLTFWGALAAGLIVFYFIHFESFPGSVPYFLHKSNGHPLFDTQISWSTSEVSQRIEDFGIAGREEYVFRNLTTDIILPLSILPFLVLGIRRFNRAYPLGPHSLILLALPFGYVALDLLENLIVIALIKSHTTKLDLLATTLPIATMLKRGAIFFTLTTLVLGLVHSVVRRVLSLRTTES